jgi:hypothetical protein
MRNKTKISKVVLISEETKAEILGTYGTETETEQKLRKAKAIETELKPLIALADSLHYRVSIDCERFLLTSECGHYPIREIRLGVKDVELEDLEILRFVFAHEIGHIQLELNGISESQSLIETLAKLGIHSKRTKQIETYAWKKASEILHIQLEDISARRFLAFSHDCIITYFP